MHANICFNAIKSVHTYVGNLEKNLPIYVKSVMNICRHCQHVDIHLPTLLACWHSLANTCWHVINTSPYILARWWSLAKHLLTCDYHQMIISYDNICWNNYDYHANICWYLINLGDWVIVRHISTCNGFVAWWHMLAYPKWDVNIHQHAKKMHTTTY